MTLPEKVRSESFFSLRRARYLRVGECQGKNIAMALKIYGSGVKNRTSTLLEHFYYVRNLNKQ